jgi:signal transduction histidine kinase
MSRRDKSSSKAAKTQRHGTLSSDKRASISRRYSSVTAVDETGVAQLIRERDEALQQQIATSEVLSIIRRSPADAQPVFDAIVQSAARLCGAIFSVVYLHNNDRMRTAATSNFSPAATSQIQEMQELKRPSRSHLAGRAILDRAVVHVHDVLADPEYSRELALAGGWRAVLSVPLLRDGEPVGAISVGKAEPTPYSDRQVQLLETFADQALIAIENVRLFEAEQARTRELSEALEQQTATADVLKVISRSAFDLQAVLDTLVESAAKLCYADRAAMRLLRDGAYHAVAIHGFSHQHVEYMKSNATTADRTSMAGRAVLEGKPVHVADIQSDPELTLLRAAPGAANVRTLLGVTMLREGAPIGVLVLSREKVEPFTDKQIELVSTFADQAVIAVENARLFDEVQARTRELTKSLEVLRTTQDRLVQTQKLALLGQLTAGIAHEIKNPLNFVNNFSGISAELIDELQDTLKSMPLDDKARAEINELTNTLKGNFDKVVHHGRRADAIVRNMLQHSREGSGEHRVVDINALVEESLNLAWHGARAETQGFEIKLKQSFDPSAGAADIFPQDIRRALLNMISNGFYAATRRKAETNGGDYEPTLMASTKSLGDSVEISLRDNGMGMPPDVKEKMFNPFFTTKPTGEGTGLGLSISHDIIVKQHGGSIEVDTQPGEFTEIRVILPRVAVFV